MVREIKSVKKLNVIPKYKKTVSELKNTLVGMNSILDTAGIFFKK